MSKILCPRCGQDFVTKALIKPLNITVHLCPECDACWHLSDEITFGNFFDFSTYMAEFGLTGGGGWDYLELGK